MGDAKLRLALTTQADVAAETYYIDSGTDRIMALNHTEQEWSQTAQVTIQDSDGTVAALDRKGYKAYISWGYGANYSACAPLEVIAQSTRSSPGSIATSFRLAGVFDMMGEDHASEAYNPEDTNTDTVKTILQAIAGATMACFSHCKAYTITFDSEDSLIDTFKPADYFSVSSGESRLSAFRKALAFCKCKARIEADGYIHIFVPTISGNTWVAATAYVLNDYVQPATPLENFAFKCTTAGTSHATTEPTFPTTEGGTVTDGTVVWTAVAFDYEYDDAVTGHNFFEKGVRKRLTIPNKQTVRSHPDHEVQYTGYATDATSYAALGRYMEGAPVYIRATSNAFCTSIAGAMIQNLQLDAERGHGFAPMNCGQEVMDYVKITDSWVGDSRIGNVGYINRKYQATGRPEDFSMEFRFGKPALAGVGRPIFAGVGVVSYDDLNAVMDYVDNVLEDLARWIIEREVVPRWHVTHQMIIPTPNYIVE